MSRYNRNGLPWSSGIGKDVTDCVTSEEVMKKVGLDFFVDKCELVAKMPFSINSLKNGTAIEDDSDAFSYGGSIYRDCPNAYATYRTDLNIPLGVVKSKYQVVQNLDAFNFFDEAIGEGKALWQTAGSFGLGHKIFVTAKLPIVTGLNSHDPIDNYLVFSNSHDGSTSVNIMFTPIRVICTNMLNGARDSADTYIRLRHTKTVKERLEIGSRILKIACEYAKDANQLYASLYKTRMSDDDVMKYIANLQLTDDEQVLLNAYDPVNGYKRLINRDFLVQERTGISTRKLNQIIGTFEYYLDGIGQKEIAGTAWGAYNAVTGFYSNVANLEGEKRMESLCWGTANRNMSNALNAAIDFKAA